MCCGVQELYGTVQVHASQSAAKPLTCDLFLFSKSTNRLYRLCIMLGRTSCRQLPGGPEAFLQAVPQLRAFTWPACGTDPHRAFAATEASPRLTLRRLHGMQIQNSPRAASRRLQRRFRPGQALCAEYITGIFSVTRHPPSTREKLLPETRSSSYSRVIFHNGQQQ
jgi:hypothetical protein